MSKTRQRHRITTTEVEANGRHFTLTFMPDGMHVHEKFQPTKKDKILSLADLTGMEPKGKPVKAVVKFPDGSPCETLDVAACNLCDLAESVHAKDVPDKEGLATVRESVGKALKVVRSLETLAE